MSNRATVDCRREAEKQFLRCLKEMMGYYGDRFVEADEGFETSNEEDCWRSICGLLLRVKDAKDQGHKLFHGAMSLFHENELGAIHLGQVKDAAVKPLEVMFRRHVRKAADQMSEAGRCRQHR